MSIERMCECGSVMGTYDLSCKSCGKSFKVRDEYLVGKDILPEPPVDLWAAQHRYKESKKSKKRWVPKVRGSQIPTAPSSLSSGVYNFVTALLLVIAFLAVIVLREQLITEYNAMPFAIIAITLLISFVALRNDRFFQNILMNPYQITRNREYYRLLSSGFAHINTGHFILNALGLYFFGPYLMEFLDDAYGINAPIAFLLIYLSAIVLADIPDLIRHRNNSGYTAVGASGAISAVVAGAAISDPDLEVSLLFLPSEIAVPGIVYAFGFLAVSLYLDYRGTGRIAHLAHAAGTVYGLIIVTMISITFNLGFANSSTASTYTSQPTSLIEKLNSSGQQSWAYETDDAWKEWGATEVIYADQCVVITFGTSSDVDYLKNSWADLTWDREPPESWFVENQGLIAASSGTACAITAAGALNWDLS
jgi:membrane associated rhomboid family serine protease